MWETILAYLIQFGLGRLILKIGSLLMPRIRKKILKKIKDEIQIESGGDIVLNTAEIAPSVFFPINMMSKTEFDARPQTLTAWVLLDDTPLDRIVVKRADKIIDVNPNTIEDLPAKKNRSLRIYYRLPFIKTSVGKKWIKLHGVITFDTKFGTFDKFFNIDYSVKPDEWARVINLWKD